LRNHDFALCRERSGSREHKAAPSLSATFSEPQASYWQAIGWAELRAAAPNFAACCPDEAVRAPPSELLHYYFSPYTCSTPTPFLRILSSFRLLSSSFRNRSLRSTMASPLRLGSSLLRSSSRPFVQKAAFNGIRCASTGVRTCKATLRTDRPLTYHSL
jgi:hypothetical protein